MIDLCSGLRLLALALLASSLVACDGSDNEGGGTAHVGSRDCDVIRTSTSDPATAQACDDCPGAACTATDCANLPCEDGGIVVQGCADDGDCAAHFSDAKFCGKHQGADNICVVNDDL